MKDYYDKGHHDVQYKPGDFVWLRLQPYRQNSIAGTRDKLSPKYFGPFNIIPQVGQVAYKLQLPPESKLHDVFHVSLLKPLKGSVPTTIPSLPPIEEGKVSLTPIKVLHARKNAERKEILVQWSHTDVTEATWEDLQVFQHVFLTFELKDKLFSQGRSDVMDWIAERVIQTRRG
ncbi:uncharacterized protein [Aristolochia californica]|uniref:uncharacterized protein n=1 Tax=Aristolochia californica TaxID=171875 RepID=UPI0035D771FF